MPKYRHFVAGSDTMQQVHGAGAKSNHGLTGQPDRIGFDL
jgi:hypothetical protein